MDVCEAGPPRREGDGETPKDKTPSMVTHPNDIKGWGEHIGGKGGGELTVKRR